MIHGSISYYHLHYFEIYIFLSFCIIKSPKPSINQQTHVNRTFDDVEHDGQQVLELMLLGGPVLKGLDDGGESGVGLETGVYKVPYNPFFLPPHIFSSPFPFYILPNSLNIVK